MYKNPRFFFSVAIAAGVLSVFSLPSTSTAQTTSAANDAEVQAQTNWREAIQSIEAPAKGCFRASYPKLAWEETECSTKPVTFRSARHPKAPSPNGNDLVEEKSASQQVTGGNGNDYIIQTSTLISSATGSFPTVTGVRAEKGVGNPQYYQNGKFVGGTLGANEYTLQLNTNMANTAACNGYTSCTAWAQFIYDSDAFTNGDAGVFIQYWLENYGQHTGADICPSGFEDAGQDANGGAGDDCVYNSPAIVAKTITASELEQVKLSGSTVAGGSDTLTFTNGTTAYTTSNADSVVDIANVWKQGEFNIVGNGGGSIAHFNSGSSLTVKIAVTDGSTTAPSCLGPAYTSSFSGYTGESNNLTVGSSCTKAGGTNPYIQFTESR